MNLIIDAGNTAVKLAVFEEGHLIFTQHVDAVYQDFKVVQDEYPQINAVLICDVRGLDWSFLTQLFKENDIHTLVSNWDFPFDSIYKTPETLGVDRIGLMAAAAKTYPLQNVLVIDIGSCITYDVLTKQNTYVGGLISPGYSMRYKSLHEFTGKLPLITHQSVETVLGVDTKTSIQAGVYQSVFYEIRGQIEHFRHKYQDLTIILTGGDCKQLSKRLKNPIFAHLNFLAIGLDYILELNKKQL
jgi:type III pantothenate kinase